MKKLLFLAIVTILATHSHAVYAYTISPATINNINTTISTDFPSTVGWWNIFDQNGDFVTLFDDAYAPYPYPIAQDIGEGVFTFLAMDTGGTGQYSDQFTTQICQNACEYPTTANVNDCKNLCVDYEGTEVVVTISYSTPAPSIWKGNNGFWGSTTPMMIIDDMTASVQDTGANVWPLLTFVGIPVGFMIALYLVYMINAELKPTKTTDEPGNPKRRRGRRNPLV